ncbi:MAG: DNA ligase, partial [Candidatus Cloacimonetes bacterium]|nr:DNA ligase [Candidatus Cloacimonadota bacterium]
MNFSELANYFEKLEKTSGRIEMTEILAELFAKAPLAEIDKICYLLLGRLVPLFESLEFNIAEKMVIKILAAAFKKPEGEVKQLFKKTGDLGLVAERLATAEALKELKRRGGLSVVETYKRLYEIAIASGAGSQEKKIKLFSELLSQVEPLSAKYLVRIPLGRMRLGLADKTLIEALSWLRKGDKSMKGEVEKYYFVYPDIGVIAKEFKKGGISALEKIETEVGVPILPELCQRIGSADEIIEKMGNVAVEPKFDGTRIQLHFSREKEWEELPQAEFDFGEIRKKGFVKAFTRNLEEVTQMFPEIIKAAFEQIDASELILDGEAVGYDPENEKFLPFQVTIQRKRKYGVKEKVAEIPLRYFAFDILYKDGENLLGIG